MDNMSKFDNTMLTKYFKHFFVYKSCKYDPRSQKFVCKKAVPRGVRGFISDEESEK